MSNPFVSKLNEKNLCTWYILPLVDLNLECFGTANVIDTYLVKDRMQIAVHVADINLCRNLLKHPQYATIHTKDESEVLIFDIPEGWFKDYRLFLAGKYSKMTAIAKDKIRERSGLKFEFSDENGNKITDAILMALDKHPVLRKKWVEIIGPSAAGHMPEELLSLPKAESFISL